jgi:hypothetical protein
VGEPGGNFSLIMPSVSPYERNGRHEETRTPDLYRVKGHMTNTLNNLHYDRDCLSTRKYV